MKARRIRWIAIPLAVALVIATVHGFVAWRATALVNQALSRAVAGMPDAQMDAEAATASLLSGRLRAESVRLDSRMPRVAPLFQAGFIDVDASWPASVRHRRWVVRRLAMTDARLRIERYADETWNLAVLLPPPQPEPATGLPVAPVVDGDAPATDAPPATDTPPATPPDTPPAKPMPAVQVDRLALTVTIEWRDAMATGALVAVDYRLTLNAEDVRTVGDAAQPWANVRLIGHLADAPRRAHLALTGRLAPVYDPARLSFDLSGSLTGVDGALLRQMSGWDVDMDAATFDVAVVCRDGMIDPARSRLTLRARSLRLGDSFHRSLAGMRLSRLTIPLGLSGAIDHPRIAWDQALAEAIRQAGNAAVRQGVEKYLR